MKGMVAECIFQMRVRNSYVIQIKMMIKERSATSAENEEFQAKITSKEHGNLQRYQSSAKSGAELDIEEAEGLAVSKVTC
jgi:hypothetical protein